MKRTRIKPISEKMKAQKVKERELATELWVKQTKKVVPDHFICYDVSIRGDCLCLH